MKLLTLLLLLVSFNASAGECVRIDNKTCKFEDVGNVYYIFIDQKKISYLKKAN
jgi:hypothetical protein